MPIVSVNKKHSFSRFKKFYSTQKLLNERGVISEPRMKGELVIWDESPGRSIKDIPLTFTLYQKLSKARNKLGLGVLVGLYSVEYDLNWKMFNAEALECANRIKSNIRDTSWFDVILLLMTARHVDDAEMREWAVKWLSHLSKNFEGFGEILNRLAAIRYRDIH